MTDERKQELKQLLHEAMGKLIILYEHRPSHIPIDVYKRYLQERWKYYGMDFLSFSFMTNFWLVIEGENTESKSFDLLNKNTKLINFIEKELTPFFHGDLIQTGSYTVESGFPDGSHLAHTQSGSNQSHHILQRLLEIAIVRGIEEAVLAFDRSCHPEGLLGFFQYVALVEGLKVETELQIYEGVRLVPLPPLNTEKITSEVIRYLPGFPSHAFIRQADTFFGKTLLVIDCPGFSIFHKPPERLFESGTRVADLSFDVEERDVKFQNRKEINAFIKDFFLQALSLVCNSWFEIYHIGWFLAEDKSLHTQGQTISTRHPLLERGRFVRSTKAEQSEIDQAKCLYNRLTNLNNGTFKKLQIPINRCIKSKISQTSEDKIIDLAIAFEALYLPDIGESTFKLGVRASWYLGNHKKDREELREVFTKFYGFRSKVVHGRKPNGEENITIKGEPIPVSKFITRVQNLCLKSIEKIIKYCLKEGKFPDNDYWNSLILGDADS